MKRTTDSTRGGFGIDGRAASGGSVEDCDFAHISHDERRERDDVDDVPLTAPEVATE